MHKIKSFFSTFKLYFSTLIPKALPQTEQQIEEVTKLLCKQQNWQYTDMHLFTVANQIMRLPAEAKRVSANFFTQYIKRQTANNAAFVALENIKARAKQNEKTETQN